jgi:phosphorylcholine metabolism protein LicD
MICFSYRIEAKVNLFRIRHIGVVLFDEQIKHTDGQSKEKHTKGVTMKIQIYTINMKKIKAVYK